MADIEMSEVPSDEEEIIGDIDENTSLRNEGVKKVKSSNWRTLCCKALIILIAVIIFLAILIRSWSDYGTYITKHVFPPAVHSMSVQCQSSSKDIFNAPTCTWNHTDTFLLRCDLDKPNKYLVDITARETADITWDHYLDIAFRENVSCTSLIIWSI